MYKDTILIVYPVGGYGTFIEWCLNYFTGVLPLDSVPFTLTGSSHRFPGNFLDLDTTTTEEYFLNNPAHPFVRTHGYLKNLSLVPGYTVKQYTDTVLDQVKKVVLLTASADARLLILYNSITKPKIGNLKIGTFEQRVIQEFQVQFGLQPGQDIPIWQLREMISYWQERHLDHGIVDVYKPVQDPKIINVSIRDLVDTFEKTIVQLIQDLGLELQREDQLSTINQLWAPLQKFQGSDQHCQNIINSVLNNTDYHWATLTIYEEAFIQHQLRDLHRLDLLCYNLDTFPTNATNLRKILINV
jgi:hypothetical protein